MIGKTTLLLTSNGLRVNFFGNIVFVHLIKLVEKKNKTVISYKIC